MALGLWDPQQVLEPGTTVSTDERAWRSKGPCGGLVKILTFLSETVTPRRGNTERTKQRKHSPLRRREEVSGAGSPRRSPLLASTSWATRSSGDWRPRPGAFAECVSESGWCLPLRACGKQNAESGRVQSSTRVPGRRTRAVNRRDVMGTCIFSIKCSHWHKVSQTLAWKRVRGRAGRRGTSGRGHASPGGDPALALSPVRASPLGGRARAQGQDRTARGPPPGRGLRPDAARGAPREAPRGLAQGLGAELGPQSSPGPGPSARSRGPGRGRTEHGRGARGAGLRGAARGRPGGARAQRPGQLRRAARVRDGKALPARRGEPSRRFLLERVAARVGPEAPGGVTCAPSLPLPSPLRFELCHQANIL